MASIGTREEAEAGPRWLYLGMAIAVAGTVAWGFGPTFTRSLAPPGLPFWVHLHAAAMVSWVLLFGVQAALIRRGAQRLHRRLGLAGAGLAGLILPLGVATTLLCVRRGAVPPFFSPEQMVAIDLVDLGAFALLVGTAFVVRRRTGWHRRLMLAGTVALLAPAVGRILPVMSLGPSIWGVLLACKLVLLLIAVGVDVLAHRRLHPAWILSAAVIVVAGCAPPFLARTSPLHALVQSVGAQP